MHIQAKAIPVETYERKLGIGYTREGLKSLCMSYDIDRDGRLSKRELEKMFKGLGSRYSSYRAHRALSLSDANRDGYIGEEDLDQLADYVINCGFEIETPSYARRNFQPFINQRTTAGRRKQEIADFEVSRPKEKIVKPIEQSFSSPINEPKEIVRAKPERIFSTVIEEQPNIVEQGENATEQGNSAVKEEKVRMVLSEQQISAIFKKFDPNGERIILEKKLMFSFYHFGTLFPQFGPIDISNADKDGFIKLKNLDALVDYAIKRGYTVK